MVERDDNGRFQKGYSGNPKGRPPKDRRERYYKIMVTACTFKDWREIIKRAVADAKRGDTAARKWLTDYIVGTAPQSIDLTTGGEMLKLILEWDENGDGNNDA